jgi:type I restriction-modification system DNA methylase subunit
MTGGCSPDHVSRIESFSSLLNYFREHLNWPLEPAHIEEVSFEWTPDDLRVSDRAGAHLKDGSVRQLQPLTTDQPWGIFFIEFTDGRVYRTALREVLRGLVPSRRRDSNLPAWRHEDLLFLCTTAEYDRFTFVHFQGEQAQKARLASFGWERGSSYLRTLCEFNFPRLRWPEEESDAKAWRKQWTSAFDKEPLTREFFKRFDQCLERIQADLVKHQGMTSAQAYTQAQLLLERLLFLYFLQNRGWLDQQRNYLISNFRQHANQPKDFTYYEEFLEKLFWTLASAPGSAARLDGIPFLNGGLFDDDDFAQTPLRKKHNPPLRVRNDTFAHIFEYLLEAFNFTVREDTPLNQDVAVDPEMLGKVFESIVLHAEAADPDAIAPDKRKATGSYYTPRIVVHFICREALRQYLLTHATDLANHIAKVNALFAVDGSDGLEPEELASLKKALQPADGRRLFEILKEIKACDPAVGSGAFPVGLLHELVALRRMAETVANGFVDPVRQQGHQWIHDTKADIVERGLYGVDIQQQAIEICRLRLWLSLIVDYDLGLDPFTADVQQFRQAITRISQLPNLEMNFRRGDSLLDIISGVVVRVAPERSDRYRKEYERIHRLGLELHKAVRSERKRKLRVEILRERLGLSEKVLTDELRQLQTDDSSLATDLFGESKSATERRRQIALEVERIQEALEKVHSDQKTLEKLAAQPMAGDFNPRLRKLEGADFDSPFNFAWRLDFPNILGKGREFTPKVPQDGRLGQPPLGGDSDRGGFDLILGNPPFVTARNAEKRRLYAERWPTVCYKNYLLVCPFFQLGFSLLRPGGELGFIVSNAFATRDLGKPLIEKFFPTVEVQKLVDCSGLMFPGHGTPTCILLGRNFKPNSTSVIRIAAILPGGGDLRTPPEESSLWHSLAAQHNNPGYLDARISVSDRSRVEMAKWPWRIWASEAEAPARIETPLSDFCAEPIGAQFITGKDEAFVISADYARRAEIESFVLKPYATGEDIRNWAILPTELILFPYQPETLQPMSEPLPPGLHKHLKPYRETLENVVVSGSTKKKETKLKWFEFRRLARAKFEVEFNLMLPQIATHAHFVLAPHSTAFKEKAEAAVLARPLGLRELHFVAAILNSSLALRELKRTCFNKGTGEDDYRDRYEFSGGKIEGFRLIGAAAEVLRGKADPLAARLTALSQACWERGQQMPGLALKKLFEKPGEAYSEWNSSLSSYISPDRRLGKPFETTEDLGAAFARTSGARDGLRAGMIGLQEEMDWLVYGMYDLIPLDHPAASALDGAMGPKGRVLPLAREQRPFVLWSQAAGDFTRAVGLIPVDWAEERRALWRARLELIRDNEHIRRIEQPLYKRRWDEQWKVRNRWQCGPVAYDAELVEAFDWWLSEKAEWWLERKAHGGPVDLTNWTATISADARVQAAWAVVSEAFQRLNRFKPFDGYFRELVKDQCVPDDIPWAVPWEELEKKRKISPSVKRIRGRLNVPRERFRVTPDGQFVWAGRELRKETGRA